MYLSGKLVKASIIGTTFYDGPIYVELKVELQQLPSKNPAVSLPPAGPQQPAQLLPQPPALLGPPPPAT